MIQDKIDTVGARSALREAAAATLRANDQGSWTRASSSLYPHLWSWDNAFVSIGWSRLDAIRAVTELESLFAAQWSTGKVPHIVFDDDAPDGSYFPSADHWMCAVLNRQSPGSHKASGLIQPPVHAIAAARIWDVAKRLDTATSVQVRSSLLRLYPRLLRWHRYLLTARDPQGSGLITIFHPWESGTDNAPRWDGPLARVVPGGMPSYPRADLNHEAVALERPSQWEYDRYVWLVRRLQEDCYDEALLHQHHSFVVKDVLASAILVAANEELLRVAEAIGAPDYELHEIRGWRDRGRKGVASSWDAELGLSLDHDLRTGEPLRVRTIAGIAAPLLARTDDDQLSTAADVLTSEAFAGHPRLHWPLPPSTSPDESGFHPRTYWRGPVWPVMNWLLWWGLRRAGEHQHAAHLRTAGLQQLLEADSHFPEYVEPFTGEPLGSSQQSWTAAVALDWLSSDGSAI